MLEWKEGSYMRKSESVASIETWRGAERGDSLFKRSVELVRQWPFWNSDNKASFTSMQRERPKEAGLRLLQTKRAESVADSTG